MCSVNSFEEEKKLADEEESSQPKTFSAIVE
jgi:hypothetical protein